MQKSFTQSRWLVGWSVGWCWYSLDFFVVCSNLLWVLVLVLVLFVVVDVIRPQFPAEKVWHVFQIRCSSKKQILQLRAQSIAEKERQPHRSRHARFVRLAGCRHSKTTVGSEHTGVPPPGDSVEPYSLVGLGHGEPRWKR